MKQYLTQTRETIDILRQGGVGILPTDTIYGLVGSAGSKDAVARIYSLRHRNPKKSMIILISSLSDLGEFGVRPSPQVKKMLKKYWPGKVSIILPIIRRGKFLTKFSYLHRGTEQLAFRLPAPRWLRALLRKTGPLVAPSANLEGHPPAETIRAAKKYFKNNVDFYLDAGPLRSKPSTLIKIERGKVKILRA